MTRLLVALLAVFIVTSSASAQDQTSPRGAFGVALTTGLAPFVAGLTLDYDITPSLNARFSIAPYPEALALDLAYAFRAENTWRIYGVAGVTYRFFSGYVSTSRLSLAAGIGAEYRFVFGSALAQLPLWTRFEFGLATPNDFGYSAIGLFARFATVIRI